MLIRLLPTVGVLTPRDRYKSRKVSVAVPKQVDHELRHHDGLAVAGVITAQLVTPT